MWKIVGLIIGNSLESFVKNTVLYVIACYITSCFVKNISMTAFIVSVVIFIFEKLLIEFLFSQAKK